ncbi:MAG: sulfatase-like hydrolase/transferase [bacterium]|nr:sulfatase-like hydrolase/transferase [bacterium]MCM1375401.1 sulfatase-like hydrolase/transferase [Muribaculum sp.]
MSSWFIYAGILVYMEAVFHLGCFGLVGINPVFLIGLITMIAAIQALISGSLPRRNRYRAFWVMMILQYLIFFVQTVYFWIFQQPLQIKAILVGGQDALTNYWREALKGLLHASPLLILLALPLIALGIWKYLTTWELPYLSSIKRLRMGLIAGAALIYSITVIQIGNVLDTMYAEEYQEFYDPVLVMRDMGVLALVQRDSFYEMGELASSLWDRMSAPDVGSQDPDSLLARGDGESASTEESLPDTEQWTEPESSPEPTQTPEPVLDTSPHAWDLDMEKLTQLSQDNKETRWLVEYIQGQEPTNRNEYTGMFEGYNLIFLTAEGFSTYAMREDLTPTLYKMVNSGFVFNNYYVPVWSTSTIDGEYVNMTALIPDGQFSLRTSADKGMDWAFSLPRFFAKEGVYNWAYHNNTLSYYDRYRTHPNIGYDFKASKLGDLPESEYGDKLFYMEHAGAWPASDYEMMLGTVPEYVNLDRFNVYYMTISGHMYYSFTGNRMSSWHKEEVQGLDMSENGQAYIACNMELDKAMANLLEQLEAAGQLEKTVICLSADHHPYAMTQEQYNELAGKDLSKDNDTYRNSLILWNAAMEESVIVDKVCGSMDLLPTLLNLFGFDYDSRMYAGKDIFSDHEGMVILKDRSFVTDTVAYDRGAKTTTFRKEMSEEEQEAYMDQAKQEVKNRYNFSAYILRNDYYRLIRQCLDEEKTAYNPERPAEAVLPWPTPEPVGGDAAGQ